MGGHPRPGLEAVGVEGAPPSHWALQGCRNAILPELNSTPGP